MSKKDDSQPKFAGKKRVRFLVQKPFGEAIKRGAKRLDLSVSQFVERAIREKLPAAEKAAQIVSSGNPSAIAALDRGLATIEQLPRDATSAQIRAAKRKLRSIAAGVTSSKKQRVRQSKTSRPIVHPVATPVVADYPQALRTFWHRNVAPAPWFDPQKEHLVTVILDTRLRAVAFSLVSIGSLNEAIAHPREVLRPVLDQAGYAFAVLHNHPSGVPSPSDTDHALTRRLIDSAEVLQVRFVDHVIIGAGRDYFSFCEAGVIGDGNTPATMRDEAGVKIASGEHSEQRHPPVCA